MRSEHKLNGVEEDALSRAHHFYRFRSTTRKQIKRMAHRTDRRKARRAIREESR